MGTRALLAALWLAGCAGAPAPDPGAEVPVVATFSIVARDPSNGELGIAVASRFLSVGAVVPWAEAEVGAIATQAWANTRFGPAGLALLKPDRDAKKALAELLATDPRAARRQVGIVSSTGDVAAHTGEGCHDWAGHKTGDGYTCQGNILTGPEVLDAMATAFEAARGDLADRLCAALLAGDRAGGDSRGKQSAAVFVVRRQGGYAGLNDRLVDLRVDDHGDPVAELIRLNKIHRGLRGISGRRRPADAPPPAPKDDEKEDF